MISGGMVQVQVSSVLKSQLNCNPKCGLHPSKLLFTSRILTICICCRLAWFYQGIGFIILFFTLVITGVVLLLLGLRRAVLWMFLGCRRCILRRWGPKMKLESELEMEVSGGERTVWKAGPSSGISPRSTSPPEIV